MIYDHWYEDVPTLLSPPDWAPDGGVALDWEANGPSSEQSIVELEASTITAPAFPLYDVLIEDDFMILQPTSDLHAATDVQPATPPTLIEPSVKDQALLAGYYDENGEWVDEVDDIIVTGQPPVNPNQMDPYDIMVGMEALSRFLEGLPSTDVSGFPLADDLPDESDLPESEAEPAQDPGTMTDAQLRDKAAESRAKAAEHREQEAQARRMAEFHLENLRQAGRPDDPRSLQLVAPAWLFVAWQHKLRAEDHEQRAAAYEQELSRRTGQ